MKIIPCRLQYADTGGPAAAPQHGKNEQQHRGHHKDRYGLDDQFHFGPPLIRTSNHIERTAYRSGV